MTPRPRPTDDEPDDLSALLADDDEGRDLRTIAADARDVLPDVFAILDGRTGLD
ncbi:hypothetical protein [Roseospirillum parvum]|uniref:Uncharacterized protein n=1 Tax=Roseospirillum parvum TaxID=83401 RepID=A0A1G8E7B3_9PROT|nr:hypothetical protein [Roseospirillum parvum]SDH65529.1 hypothetical protein SAMN05421742_10952 [Roseospirillum parvum]